MLNALSVDVEDWFQVGAFENVISRADWDGLPHRVERNSDAVLALFERAGVKATFFTLGWVAQRYPALIRRIVDAGHEIASHGWDHVRVFTMSPAVFRADLERARIAIEDASGVSPMGYRAPSFSIDARTPWAHRILAEEGYAYSSSVAPIRHDHYGWPEAPALRLPSGRGVEPHRASSHHREFGGRRMAAGGGGFFRLLPYGFSSWAISRVNRRGGAPRRLLFPPWEIDPDQPRVDNAPLKSRVRHYSKLAAMEGKLPGNSSGRRLGGETDEVVEAERARLQ
jgi:polysaccharide deacetylase family protein (PEP-CTERM system associated)